MSTLDLVVAGYIVRDRKVLLIDHKKLNNWLPVGGHIEDNETPDDALKREAREELNGVEIIFLQYPKPRRGNVRNCALPFYTNVHHIGDTHLHYCLFYLCTTNSAEVNPNLNEINGCKWFSPDELNAERVPESVKLTALEALELEKLIN